MEAEGPDEPTGADRLVEALIDHGVDTNFGHEIPHQMQALASVSKRQARFRAPQQVGAVMAEAFARMMSGRKRKVAVGLPPDIAARRASAQASSPVLPPLGPPPLDPDLVTAAARLLVEPPPQADRRNRNVLEMAAGWLTTGGRRLPVLRARVFAATQDKRGKNAGAFAGRPGGRGDPRAICSPLALRAVNRLARCDDAAARNNQAGRDRD